jgi:RimJ/RimL family protein N-acetyltransferase
MADVVAETGFPPLDVRLRDGRLVTMRAVRPEDRDALQAAVTKLSPESRYSRFMSAVLELSPQMLERGIHPQDGRELQLVAECAEEVDQAIVGGARYSAAAGSKDCEFSVAVADSWQGTGLARRLLEALIAAARRAGFERMEGYVLASNTRMLGLARRLGFAQVESPEGPAVRLMRRSLSSSG